MRSLVLDPTAVTRFGARAFSRLTRRPYLALGSPLRLVEVEAPAIPHPRYVQLRTRLCGICGTDLQLLDTAGASGTSRRPGPLFLGHEIVAEVVAVGAEVTRVRPGDRVCIADDRNCETFDLPSCRSCAEGLPLLCTNKRRRRYYGHVGAGWSEMLVRHEHQCFPVPAALPDEIAVLMEPAAVGLHAVLRHPPSADDRVLVVGAGTIGLGLVAALRAARTGPLDVTVLARHAFQADEARRLGADRVVTLADALPPADGGTLDVVYDCVGSAGTLALATARLRPRGTLVLVGSDPLPGAVDFGPVWRRELTILGTHGYAHDTWEGTTRHTVARCLAWAAEGRLVVGSLLTHRFPLADYKRALRTAASHHRRGRGAAATAARKVAFDYAA